jgi:uncharacterized surface protein with fasciclin (FAS1) repeats
MKIGNRVTRFALSMAVAGAIYSQIPVGNGLAAAYGGGGGGKTAIAIAAGAGAIYTIATIATGGGGAPPVAPPVSSPVVPVVGVETSSLYDAAAANPDLTTFAAQADAADLKDDLRKGGPYTIFAPTNAAFAAFQTANPTAFADLQKSENKSQLKALLSYHVVNGRYTIADLKGMAEGTKLTTIGGGAVTITNADGLKVNSVSVVETDIPASNGIIHPIGDLLSPPAPTPAPAP